MPTYVTLVNFTDEGRENLDGLPGHVEQIKQLKRSLGGTPKGFFLTLGQYDLVAFSEMPDAETVAQLQLTAAAGGDVETETLRAFTMDEVADLVEGLPE